MSFTIKLLTVLAFIGFAMSEQKFEHTIISLINPNPKENLIDAIDKVLLRLLVNRHSLHVVGAIHKQRLNQFNDFLSIFLAKIAQKYPVTLKMAEKINLKDQHHKHTIYLVDKIQNVSSLLELSEHDVNETSY